MHDALLFSDRSFAAIVAGQERRWNLPRQRERTSRPRRMSCAVIATASCRFPLSRRYRRQRRRPDDPAVSNGCRSPPQGRRALTPWPDAPDAGVIRWRDAEHLEGDDWTALAGQCGCMLRVEVPPNAHRRLHVGELLRLSTRHGEVGEAACR